MDYAKNPFYKYCCRENAYLWHKCALTGGTFVLSKEKIYTFPTKQPSKNYTFPINNNKKNYTFPKKQPEKLFFSIETENYQLSRQSCRRAERRGEQSLRKALLVSAHRYGHFCPSYWTTLPNVMGKVAQCDGQST